MKCSWFIILDTQHNEQLIIGEVGFFTRKKKICLACALRLVVKICKCKADKQRDIGSVTKKFTQRWPRAMHRCFTGINFAAGRLILWILSSDSDMVSEVPTSSSGAFCLPLLYTYLE